jgi:hypothetical protein
MIVKLREIEREERDSLERGKEDHLDTEGEVCQLCLALQ